MENASRALVMAGSVLIAIVIIGALILMFSNLTAYQGSNTQNTREAQIQAFNQEFLTYNRKNVRGNEILTLVNKVVDYNERKSLGNIAKDIQYEPMTIIIRIDSSATGDTNRKKLTLKSSNELFTQAEYIQNDNTRKLGNIIDVCETIQEKCTSSDVATKLVTNITKLYGIDENNTEQVKQADKVYNSIVPKRIGYSGRLAAKDDIYKYYEFVQFKRAYFDTVSTGLKYNESTGRVVQMEFEMTGKFE